MSALSVDARCPRCLQATPPRAKRCPECGERVSGSSRTLLLVFGAIGVLLLAGIISLAIFTRPDEGGTGGGNPQQQSAPARPPLN